MSSSTPIEAGPGGVFLKREDQFCIAGAYGAKARACWAIASGDPAPPGLVTAGSLWSPQVNLVARCAAALRLPARAHCPQGRLRPEVAEAAAMGWEIVQHRPGYNTVIVARAREDAKRLGWREIPFGMECQEAVDQTAAQVDWLPTEVRRIVMSVGSGMTLAGLLWGLRRTGQKVPILGVCVGADPQKRLARWAPPGWEAETLLVRSDHPYHHEVRQPWLGDVLLDPIYEAKVLPYLKPGDLFWVVGIRATLQNAAAGGWSPPAG